MKPVFQPVLVNDAYGDPAVYVDFLFQGRALLFDLGDIRALPIRKILRLTDVFVSHAHMDHFFGLDWLIRVCLGRDQKVRLYGPAGFIRQVEAKLLAYTWNLVANYETDFSLAVTEVYDDTEARTAFFSSSWRGTRINSLSKRYSATNSPSERRPAIISPPARPAALPAGRG